MEQRRDTAVKHRNVAIKAMLLVFLAGVFMSFDSGDRWEIATGVRLPGYNVGRLPRYTADIPIHTASGRFTLGSAQYESGMDAFIRSYGYKAALDKIMEDAGRYGTDLDHNSPDINVRFYTLVSHIIDKIGLVDMETHYFRNQLNRTPKSLKDLILINGVLPVHKRWRLLPVGYSLYHMQGKDGEFNLKFVSADGFCEAVYNKKGILLTEQNDPVNMGTFNYSAGLDDKTSHTRYDIDPYMKWGNTPDSPQKGIIAIRLGANIAKANYNMHSTKVVAFRDKVIREMADHPDKKSS